MEMACRDNGHRERVNGNGLQPRWAPIPLKSGVILLLSATLTGPMITTLSRNLGVGMGVLAEPCLGPEQVIFVSPDNQSLTGIFDCTGGVFEVHWSGEITVTDTIVVGKGTTVTIIGNNTRVTDDGSTSSTGSDSTSEGNRGMSGREGLSSRLSLPRGLTATARGVASSGITDDPFGSIFYVDGGELLLQDMIVCDGVADGDESGAGVYAKCSNVSITGCEFINHSAEISGGGIYVEESKLEVAHSTFTGCRAGYPSSEGDDAEGQGGGIHAKDSNVLVDGCLFDGCYAGEKGGGFNQDEGNLSVLGSVFYNNSAGSDVVEGGQVGRGADLSFSRCALSFDGLAACGANDTIFANSHVGSKGGAVAIEDKGSSYIKFHRCAVTNSSAGLTIADDPQGEGGAFYVGEGATLVLVDCNITNNRSGKKGGAITLSSGSTWTEPGAALVLWNSTFHGNEATVDDGGVVYLGNFVNLTVQGDGNVFEENTCGTDGAVFAVSADANLTIEGGNFSSNHGKNGGVFWSEGLVVIVGGSFRDNKASDDGGVFFASDNSTIAVEGGHFERNDASKGGVGCVNDGAKLTVMGGKVTGNVAHNEGGAFSVDEGGTVEITGGIFSENKADFGGFLYKKGGGNASCTGASILGHESVEGGAIYAVDGARIQWECHIGNSFALAGPAIYARDSVSLQLIGIAVFDNRMPRGSLIFLVDSDLETYQVEFNDTAESKELSAVQVDEKSSYKAEDTYFVGFAGEAVVFSEGKLYLDDCDFSGSTSSVLVYSESNSTAEIRNIVLGDKNYWGLADESSQGQQIPNADTLTNVNRLCGDRQESSSGSAHESSTFPCSTGSECFDGDVGVYCQCYERRSNQEQRCVSGNVTALNLNLTSRLKPTVHPAKPEGNLILSHGLPRSGAVESSSTISISSTDNGSGVEDAEVLNGGVVWSVEALPLDTMGWMIFPSTGLILPGESVTLRVVASPDFDGTTNATFKATGFGGVNSPEESFNVTFYHCAAGSFWDSTGSAVQDSAEGNGTCRSCTDAIDGDAQGVDCSNDGATTGMLPIKEGYWRATLGVTYVRQCANEDACKGGSDVQSVDEYCNDGYEGVVCSVCSSGYGRSTTNHCHRCTTRFEGAMYFVLCVAGLLVLVVVALLAVYLVGGGEAVSSKVASTMASVRMVHRRTTGGLSRSAGTVVGTGSGQGARSAGNENKEERRTFGGHRTQNPISNRCLVTPVAPGGQGSTEPSRHPQIGTASTGGLEPSTITTKTARILAALPLSKIKIVIVVWQISSAFAEVTSVTFPPIYETFLSIIGVFSLDLGWILSASCLASGVDFYDKLLIVTIGPIFLMVLLAATFHVGASPIRRNIATETAKEEPRMFSTPTEVSLPVLINGRRAQITMPPDWLTSARSRPGSNAGTYVAPGQAPSDVRPGVADSHTTRPTDLSLDTENNWVLGSFGDGGEMTARVAFSPPRVKDRSIVASVRSLRTISKAGPGDEADKRKNQLWGLFARHATMTLIILYLVYSQVSTVVFQTFSCDEFPEVGRHYLRADGRIECNTFIHRVYMIYAIVMIVLYPLGIPAAFFYLLVRQRSAINPPTDSSLIECRGTEYIMREKINQRSRDQTVAPTSFLWSAYFPNRYYYEVLECIRRLLLTGLLVFVPDTSGQVVYGCIFAFISLWVFELQRPHIDDLEIQLYRTGSLVIFFTNFLALILHAELAEAESSSSAVYSVVLVTIHVLFILSIGWNSWVTIKATLSGDDVKGTIRDVKEPKRRDGAPNDEEDYKTEDQEVPPGSNHHGNNPESLSDSSNGSMPADFHRL